ncbi:hypothetical protein AVEN_268831-1 [Araneus ventricosus]|uniref:Uncharacterized protein n=1 Tax=Araneus ventricosus TaxID=182803 RepID=A0A4Y2NY93_ARAVE|nr:hypothetical protein AVEN_268831-1 [Araneus ventricosus]
METGIKSTTAFGKPSALRYVRNSFSTEVPREMRLPFVPSAPNEIKPFPASSKCSGISASRTRDNGMSGVWGCSRDGNILLYYILWFIRVSRCGF